MLVLVRVVKPTKEEKRLLWRIPYIFKEKHVTPQALEEYSSRWGIHSRFLEIMFWQLDTLYLLSMSSNLVWKGGTCVQSYLRPQYQRYSVDLDLNTDLDREGVMKLIERINNIIMSDGKFVELNGARIGLLHIHSENRILGVINCFRLVPSKHWGEYPYKGEVKLLGVIPIRIQINYGYYEHMRILAMDVISRNPQLAPSQIIDVKYEFPHSSKEDLLADKLLAMVNIAEKHKGRMRIKDAYDILALLMTNNLDFDLVRRKISLVSERWNTEYDLVTKKSLEALEQMKKYTLEVLGLRGSVGHLGYAEIVSQWNDALDKALGLLRDKL